MPYLSIKNASTHAKSLKNPAFSRQKSKSYSHIKSYFDTCKTHFLSHKTYYLALGAFTLLFLFRPKWSITTSINIKSKLQRFPLSTKTTAFIPDRRAAIQQLLSPIYTDNFRTPFIQEFMLRAAQLKTCPLSGVNASIAEDDDVATLEKFLQTTDVVQSAQSDVESLDPKIQTLGLLLFQLLVAFGREDAFPGAIKAYQKAHGSKDIIHRTIAQDLSCTLADREAFPEIIAAAEAATCIQGYSQGVEIFKRLFKHDAPRAFSTATTCAQKLAENPDSSFQQLSADLFLELFQIKQSRYNVLQFVRNAAKDTNLHIQNTASQLLIKLVQMEQTFSKAVRTQIFLEATQFAATLRKSHKPEKLRLAEPLFEELINHGQSYQEATAFAQTTTNMNLLRKLVRKGQAIQQALTIAREQKSSSLFFELYTHDLFMPEYLDIVKVFLQPDPIYNQQKTTQNRAICFAFLTKVIREMGNLEFFKNKPLSARTEVLQSALNIAKIAINNTEDDYLYYLDGMDLLKIIIKQAQYFTETDRNKLFEETETTIRDSIYSSETSRQTHWLDILDILITKHNRDSPANRAIANDVRLAQAREYLANQRANYPD